MSLKISYRTLENYICAIAGILSMNPYFIWPTFMNGVLAYAAYAIYLFSAALMIRRGARLRKKGVIGVLLFCFIFILTYLHSFSGIAITTLLGGASLFLYLITFCCLKAEDQKEIFQAFVKVFVISLIPGLIYYVLELMGISLSIGRIYSQNQLTYANSAEYFSGQSTGYYKLYVGAVLRVNTNTRFAGIYDEAGLVGTVAALCLSAMHMDIKGNKWARWLLLFAIMSFSLGGYLLILIYFILSSLRKKQWKLLAILVFVTVVGYLLLTVNSNVEMIKTLQSRIQFSGTSITIKNNRETSQFNIGYAQFLNGNLIRKLFGFGRGAAAENVYMNGSSSYKCSVFNYGYLGFGLMIFEIVYLYRAYLQKIWKQHWAQFVLIALFLVSVYQRPSVYFPYYFIILYGGAAYLSDYKERCERSREICK